MRQADPGKLSTWTKFRPSLCKGCQALCCFLPVEVGVPDLVRLGLVGPDEAMSSAKKIFRRLEKQGIVQSFRARSGLFTLKQKVSGACVFLDEQRLCTVYDKRPGVCRNFPIEVGPRPGYCPESRLA